MDSKRAREARLDLEFDTWVLVREVGLLFGLLLVMKYELKR